MLQTADLTTMPQLFKSRKTQFYYMLGGSLFGAAFPLIAFAIRGYQTEFSWAALFYSHQIDPLLWIIDTAPIILGLFAYRIGIKQQQLEYQVNRNQLALDQFIASSKELLGVLNTKGELEEHSRAWINILGIPSEQIRSQSILKYVVSEDRNQVSAIINQVHALRKTGSIDFRITDHENNERWISAAIEPIKMLNKFAFFGKDITSQKISEEALIVSSKMASLGEMSAGIAHEINNPLGIIYGTVSLAFMEIESGGRVSRTRSVEQTYCKTFSDDSGNGRTYQQNYQKP